MQVKRILNRVQKHPGFVYTDMELTQEKEQLVLNITVEPRKNSRAVCSGCGAKRAGYDRLGSRRFEFVPFWGILVYFVYAMRRVECPTCGIKVERVPWAEGKRTVTTAYAWFLARWAKQLSWAQVAEAFHTSWYTVHSAVEMAVSWGRAHMDLTGITAIGVDEMAWGRGHRYVTVVYQIDQACKRLLWMGEHRKAKTLLGFFRWFGKERTAGLRYPPSVPAPPRRTRHPSQLTNDEFWTLVHCGIVRTHGKRRWVAQLFLHPRLQPVGDSGAVAMLESWPAGTWARTTR